MSSLDTFRIADHPPERRFWIFSECAISSDLVLVRG
jgi:hypothetical protein